MERAKRKVIAVKDGVVKHYDSTYACAQALGVRTQAVQQAQAWMATCNGWKIYDSADIIRERIKALEEALELVESMER